MLHANTAESKRPAATVTDDRYSSCGARPGALLLDALRRAGPQADDRRRDGPAEARLSANTAGCSHGRAPRPRTRVSAACRRVDHMDPRGVDARRVKLRPTRASPPSAWETSPPGIRSMLIIGGSLLARRSVFMLAGADWSEPWLHAGIEQPRKAMLPGHSAALSACDAKPGKDAVGARAEDRLASRRVQMG